MGFCVHSKKHINQPTYITQFVPKTCMIGTNEYLLLMCASPRHYNSLYVSFFQQINSRYLDTEETVPKAPNTTNTVVFICLIFCIQ